MKQDATISPSSFAEKILTISWITGCMVLCLAHDSVLLSFLSLPPLTRIKNLSDLADAIQEGNYHAIADNTTSFVPAYLRNTQKEHLKIIADDILRNKKKFISLLSNFVSGDKTINTALMVDRDTLGHFAEKFFIAEEFFYEHLNAMAARKGFCCRELIDAFVHRIMASGIHFKYIRDQVLFRSFPVGKMEEVNPKRKLTLIDVAPAFIILLWGYFISVLVFAWEILSNRKNGKNIKEIKVGILRKNSVITAFK